MSPISLLALAFGLAGIVLVMAAVSALRRLRLVRLVTRLSFGLAFLALGAGFAAVLFGLQGYTALTREEVAAVVRTEPAGPQRFRAHFRFADGRQADYDLAGDELYVDAHILKWKATANLLGLHTAYELDRVAGRYAKLSDEQAAPRTVQSLALDKPLDFDLFAWRRRYGFLAPVLDAEYGSASFVPADAPQTLEVRVSTTGLLIRVLDPAREP